MTCVKRGNINFLSMEEERNFMKVFKRLFLVVCLFMAVGFAGVKAAHDVIIKPNINAERAQEIADAIADKKSVEEIWKSIEKAGKEFRKIRFSVVTPESQIPGCNQSENTGVVRHTILTYALYKKSGSFVHQILDKIRLSKTRCEYLNKQPKDDYRISAVMWAAHKESWFYHNIQPGIEGLQLKNKNGWTAPMILQHRIEQEKIQREKQQEIERKQKEKIQRKKQKQQIQWEKEGKPKCGSCNQYYCDSKCYNCRECCVCHKICMGKDLTYVHSNCGKKCGMFISKCKECSYEAAQLYMREEGLCRGCYQPCSICHKVCELKDLRGDHLKPHCTNCQIGCDCCKKLYPKTQSCPCGGHNMQETSHEERYCCGMYDMQSGWCCTGECNLTRIITEIRCTKCGKHQ